MVKKLSQKFLIHLLYALLLQDSVNSATGLLLYQRMVGGCCGGINVIPDASTSAHVTGIEMGLCSDGAIYNFNIIGDGVARTPVPDGACGAPSLSSHTLTVGAEERITIFEAWINSVNSYWYRVRLTLNNGNIREYDSTPASGTNYHHYKALPSNLEFTGVELYLENN